ncbi:hypothetical protein [Neorhizobium tomejilense]|uniref:hypothetical protein n=1 Tax=Neorhizobium tomejilense TaxID=2093828 RepID=UPI003ECC8126
MNWKWKTLIVLSMSWLSFHDARADDWLPGVKEEKWIDLNFVPCDGMGATASGNIEVRIGYMKNGDVLKVSDWQLRTRYFHDHSPSANLSYQSPDGGKGSVRFEAAWFPTIGPDDGSKYLFLARKGNQDGAAGQTPFTMKAGTPVDVTVISLFPQFGGTCVASFSKNLTLP